MLKNLPDAIKLRRKKLGLSQSALAYKAEVSLPTVQKIESGKETNPSISVLTRIHHVLGLELVVSSIKPNWDYLAHHGLPINAQPKSTAPRNTTWNAERFFRELQLALLEADPVTMPRESQALLALCHALVSHYPNFIKKNNLTFISKYLDKQTTPINLKLRRIAISLIQEHL